MSNPILMFSLDEDDGLVYKLENFEDARKVGNLIANLLIEKNILDIIEEMDVAYSNSEEENSVQNLNLGYNEVMTKGVKFLRPSQMTYGEVK
jgi:ribosomal protein L18